jgi:hypothetical protein
MNWVAAIALVLLQAGGPSLEVLRADRQRAAQSVQQADAALAGPTAQLDAVSQQIESMKARRAKGELFGSGALDGLLQQSQALSEQVQQLQAARAKAQADEAGRRAALYQALDAQISQDQQVLPAASRERQQAVLAELKALQDERSQLNPIEANREGRELKFRGQTDDPRELRERADALRDQADKAGRQQRAVEARLQELRDQAELERQLHRLTGEDSLFDEGDRRVRVSTVDAAAAPGPTHDPLPTTSAVTRTTTNPMANKAAPTGVDRVGAAADNAAGVQLSPGTYAANAPSYNSTGLAPGAHLDPLPSTAASATEVGTVVRSGESVRPSDFAAPSPQRVVDEDSIESLQEERERLVREQSALRAQAQALEQAARKP